MYKSGGTVTKAIKILVINDSDDQKDTYFTDAIVKILDRDRTNKQSWINPFTDTRTVRGSPSVSVDKQSKIIRHRPVETVCIHRNDLKVAPSDPTSVTFTYLLYDGSQLKIDQGVTRTESLRDFDAVIVSGASENAIDPAVQCQMYAWVVPSHIPFFGIGSGHLIQAQMRGLNPVFDSNQAESGDHSISILKDDPIFDGLNCLLKLESFDKINRIGCRVSQNMHNGCIGTKLHVYQEHKQSMDILPEGFELLASSEKCPIQMIRDRRKKICYSTQFHAEIYNAQLLHNFVNMVECPPERELLVDNDKASDASQNMFVTEA